MNTQYSILNTQYSRRGVSLIEIMIVIAIIGIVGIGIYMFLINMTRGWALAQAKMNLQQQQAAAFHWLEYDIQNARRSTLNNYLPDMSAEIGAGWSRSNLINCSIINNSINAHSGNQYLAIGNPGAGTVLNWTSPSTTMPWGNAIVYGGWAFYSGVTPSNTTISLTANIGGTPQTAIPFDTVRPYIWQWVNGTANYGGEQVYLFGSYGGDSVGVVWFDDFYVRPWWRTGGVPNETVLIIPNITSPLRLQDTRSGREVRIYRNGNNLIRVDASNSTTTIATNLSPALPPGFYLRSWQPGVDNTTIYDVDQIWVTGEFEQTWMNESLIRQVNSWLMPRQK